jgi:hypothetical protein
MCRDQLITELFLVPLQDSVVLQRMHEYETSGKISAVELHFWQRPLQDSADALHALRLHACSRVDGLMQVVCTTRH